LFYDGSVTVRGVLRYLVDGALGRKGQMLAPGTEAPDFDAPDQNGRRVRLSTLRGKTVVLWFFPRADTPG
jgi:peroxiredoxin